jgi:hypothetical protein
LNPAPRGEISRKSLFSNPLVRLLNEVKTRQEAKQLIEEGFEYAMDKNGVSLFRKLIIISTVGTHH